MRHTFLFSKHVFTAGVLSICLAFSQGWVGAQQQPLPNAPVLTPPMGMEAASERIPAGMDLKIRFLTPLDSKTSNVGDMFVTQTTDDLWTGEQLILPKGSTIRGRVQEVQRPGFFSKGGLMRLEFDHVAMPTGELKPLSLAIDAMSAKHDTQRNALYSDPGIANKLDASVDKGVSQFKSFHERGIKAGQERGGGVNMLLTVPTNTLAGVATGTAVTTFNAAKAVFGKGESVTILPGEELIIDFAQAATLQAQ